MSRVTEANLDAASAATCGSAAILPADDVIAGSYGTWTVAYTVGAYAMDVGGGLRIGTRRQSDFGTPQFSDPKAPNYVTLKCSRPSRFHVRYDPRGHVRPFRAVIVIELGEGPLFPGDEITITLGDRSEGSPGMKAQTFPESECRFAVFVDPISSGIYRRVFQTTPHFRVVPAPSVRIELLAPSTAVAGQPFRVQVRGNDQFGNPSPADAGDLTIDTEPEIPVSLRMSDGRAKWIESVVLNRPGVRRLQLRRGNAVVATSNPIVVRPIAGPSILCWGDTQAQTASTVGIGSVREYYEFARDLAGLDFVTHQGNDFILSEDDVEEVRRETRRFCEPGRFVPFFGYEWSGATGAGGDRNILYLDNDGPIFRSSGWQLDPDEHDPKTECPSAGALHVALRKFIRENGHRVLALPHVGGRRSDINTHDPELEPVIEICSCHGIFEWRLREAIDLGLRIGVVGASDDHTGRPGLAYPSTPEMAVRGGLAAVFAMDRTRDAIAAALKARHCYATTGPRIYLDVALDGHPMGANVRLERPSALMASVHGTAPIDEICVFDRNRLVKRVVPNPERRDPRLVRFKWSGARGRDRGRSMSWDGGLSIRGGVIRTASAVNISNGKNGIVHSTSDGAAWRSVTSGQEEGVLLCVDAPDDAEIHVQAGPADFRFSLAEVRASDVTKSYGPIEQFITASTMHYEGNIADAEIDVIDDDFQPGDHAYWVRVVQRDSHRAWSSPIYVAYTPRTKL